MIPGTRNSSPAILSIKVCSVFILLFLFSFFIDVGFAQTTGTNYCNSKGHNTSHGYINKVSIETINNLSGTNGGYGDFTSQSAKLEKAATYTISLTPGFISGAAYFEYWTVYIDYNHNGIFEAGEIVAKGHNAIKINKSFTIPSTAINGSTRMRIQMQEGLQETDPCAIYAYGEVEDYTVIITSGTQYSVQDDSSPMIKTAKENTVRSKLYPIPASNNVTIEFTGNNNGVIKVNVYNQLEQRVVSTQNVSMVRSGIFNLNTSSLHTGIYIVEIEADGQRSFQKLLISR